MKREEMLNMMNVIYKNWHQSKTQRFDGFCDMLLKEMEKSGMLPPDLEWETQKDVDDNKGNK